MNYISKKSNVLQRGALIILAYPDTVVTPTGAFYNQVLKLVGIIQENKIGAGHAACVLVDPVSGELIYADFGRYITPLGRGRIRTKRTDPEVTLPINAKWSSNGQISNIEEILIFLEAHPEKTHGDGRLVASVCYDIDFKKAHAYLIKEQDRGSIHYGPFTYGGSNCTRFVADMMIENTFNKALYRKLRTVLPTPTTVSNVLKGKTIQEVYEIFNGNLKPYSESTIENFVKSFSRIKEIKKTALKCTAIGNLTEPERDQLPKNAQWLSGIGAGSWFVLSKEAILQKNEYRIRRIMPEGEIGFDAIFLSTNPDFNEGSPFQFIYDCNATWCTIQQNGQNIRFESKRNFQKTNH